MCECVCVRACVCVCVCVCVRVCKWHIDISVSLHNMLTDGCTTPVIHFTTGETEKGRGEEKRGEEKKKGEKNIVEVERKERSYREDC